MHSAASSTASSRSRLRIYLDGSTSVDGAKLAARLADTGASTSKCSPTYLTGSLTPSWSALSPVTWAGSCQALRTFRTLR